METIATESKPAITILCVDDEKNILSALRRLLRPDGYDIQLANSGAEGLEILGKMQVDLVISDMRMPEMNGAEFLEKVYAQWPDTVRILLTGYSEISSTIDAINKGSIYKYISKPWEEHDLRQTIRNALDTKKLERERDALLLVTKKQNAELKTFNTNLEGLVKKRTSELEQAMGMLESAYDTLKDSYSNTVRIFSTLIEMREGILRSQSQDVAKDAHALAIELGMNADAAKSVSFAGMLREIGKIGFPDSMIKLPLDELDNTSAAEMKKFTVLGEGILTSVEPLRDASKIIRNFRERYDGKGFPDGLAGNNIPTGSRILAIVSDFYALQNGTLVNGKHTVIQARDFLVKHAGTRYDPNLVTLYVKHLGVITNDKPVNAERELSVKQLKQGMELTKDIVTKSGVLLLSRGYVLGEHMINQLISLEQSLGEKLLLTVKDK
jgi:response regulator RpfG family c-di-GMP phosphodiesterase